MHFLLPAVPIANHKIDDPVWAIVVHKLTTPVKPDSSKFSDLFQGYRYLSFAEMVRQKWDSKFRISGRLPTNVKKQFESEGALWVRLLNLISETFLLSPAYEHPAMWFYAIVLEHEVFPATRDFSKSKVLSKTEIVRLAQSENHNLLTLSENPFKKEATKLLFDKAMPLAESKDRFRVQSYTPFVRARQASTSLISTKDYQSLSEGADGKIITSRQGRKKADQSAKKMKSTTVAV